jgi:hypothetical protein
MLNVLMLSVIAPWGVMWIFYMFIYLIFLNLKRVLECTTKREKREKERGMVRSEKETKRTVR